MPSPFPGMNPYLEQESIWHGFHQMFVPAMIAALVPQCRPRYVVRLEENIYVHHQEEGERTLAGRADVTVKPSELSGRESARGGVIDAPAYARMLPAIDVERLSYIKIVDRDGLSPVTVIELLSPSNKNPGRDREAYIVKRDRILNSGVNLVEIDLLRAGPRLPMEALPACDYHVMVSQAEERPRLAVWPIALRDRLPEIPIPLLPDDAPAKLDLQALLNRVYDEGGYEDYVYGQSLRPKLRAEDAEWARRFVPVDAQE